MFAAGTPGESILGLKGFQVESKSFYYGPKMALLWWQGDIMVCSQKLFPSKEMSMALSAADAGTSTYRPT